MIMTHKETMEFIAALREKYLGEQEETKEEKVERARAVLVCLKHGSHNQASHGFRFGKAPSLSQARRYRKAGVLQEYSKRARDRSGTKPAKERNQTVEAQMRRALGNEKREQERLKKTMQIGSHVEFYGNAPGLNPNKKHKFTGRVVRVDPTEDGKGQFATVRTSYVDKKGNTQELVRHVNTQSTTWRKVGYPEWNKGS